MPMQVSIEYCAPCKFLAQAKGLAAELQEAFGAESTLVAGAHGVFEVTVDGTLVFSKKKEGRFPSYKEVPKLIQALKTQGPG